MLMFKLSLRGGLWKTSEKNYNDILFMLCRIDYLCLFKKTSGFVFQLQRKKNLLINVVLKQKLHIFSQHFNVVKSSGEKASIAPRDECFSHICIHDYFILKNRS